MRSSPPFWLNSAKFWQSVKLRSITRLARRKSAPACGTRYRRDRLGLTRNLRSPKAVRTRAAAVGLRSIAWPQTRIHPRLIHRLGITWEWRRWGLQSRARLVSNRCHPSGQPWACVVWVAQLRRTATATGPTIDELQQPGPVDRRTATPRADERRTCNAAGAVTDLARVDGTVAKTARRQFGKALAEARPRRAHECAPLALPARGAPRSPPEWPNCTIRRPNVDADAAALPPRRLARPHLLPRRAAPTRNGILA